jgi:hypothetical protein
MLVDQTPGNDPRKRDDMVKRLEDLYSRLQEGRVKTVASQKVFQMVKAVEARDLPTANRLKQELCTIDWEMNKYWVMGVKRLIPER